LSISTVAFFALCGETIFGAGFAHKILGINQKPFAASIAFFKVFFKAHILNNECVKLRGLINPRNYFLSKDCADVISRIGFAVFLVDYVGNIRVLDFVDFQVENFLLGFS